MSGRCHETWKWEGGFWGILGNHATPPRFGKAPEKMDGWEDDPASFSDGTPPKSNIDTKNYQI